MNMKSLPREPFMERISHHRTNTIGQEIRYELQRKPECRIDRLKWIIHFALEAKMYVRELWNRSLDSR